MNVRHIDWWGREVGPPRKRAKRKPLGDGVYVLCVAIAILAGAFMVGCASVQHDPLYDGDVVIPETSSDSTTLVRLTVSNNRVEDAIAPHFYLVGNGRHALGIIEGLHKKVLFVDTKWFGPDGCMTIVAHYVGTGDFTFPRFCWERGFVIDVSLEEIFSTSSAWSHR